MVPEFPRRLVNRECHDMSKIDPISRSPRQTDQAGQTATANVEVGIRLRRGPGFPITWTESSLQPASKSSGGAPSKASSNPRPSDGKAKKPKAEGFPDGDVKGRKETTGRGDASFDAWVPGVASGS